MVTDVGSASNDERRLRRNIFWNNLNGIFQILAGNMINPFIGILAIKLNATNMQIAMLSSLPAVASVVAAIPGARLIDRRARKKGITTLFFFLNRLFFLVIAAVPFFTPDRRAAALVAAVALMNLPGAVANTAYQALMGDIIPARRRGSAMAARNFWMGLAGNVTLLGTGVLLDRLPFPVGYQWMFTAAFALAMAEVWALAQLDEPGQAPPAALRATPGPGSADAEAPFAASSVTGDAVGGSVRVAVGTPAPFGARLRAKLAEIRDQHDFVSFALTSLIFQFGWQMAWPLFTKYQVSYLGANNWWTSLISFIGGITTMIFYPVWARWADRWGTHYMLGFAAAGLATVPVLYAVSHTLRAITLFNLWMGIFVAGVVLLLFNGLLEVTPEQNRTSYVAYYNTLTNISAIIAPVVGVAIMNRFNIWVAFYAAATVRFLGALALINLPRRKKEAAA